MNDNDILAVCKSLARRYKGRNDYDDTLSEGLLAAYESIDAGRSGTKQITGAARRAMNDYVNHGSKLIKTPSGGPYRGISDDPEGRELDAVIAMKGEVVSEDTVMPSVPSHAVAYEKAEYEAYLMTVAVTCLSPKEMTLMKELYFNDMSKVDLAEKYEVSSQAITDWEAKALDKIRDHL